MSIRSYASIGFLGFALVTAPMFVPSALSQQGDASYCLSVVETGGVIPNTWLKDESCNFTVTVKWFDQGNCSGGCVETLRESRTRFTDPNGLFDFAACVGDNGPVGYDTRGDMTYTCPGA